MIPARGLQTTLGTCVPRRLAAGDGKSRIPGYQQLGLLAASRSLGLGKLGTWASVIGSWARYLSPRP